MWFGTLEKMQDVKYMLAGLPTKTVPWGETIELMNGGAAVVSSFGSNRTFDLSHHGTADETGVIKDYVEGLYGAGLVYFTLPHAERRNVLSPNWAAPRMIATVANGWPEILENAVATYAATATNTFAQPSLTATYTVTNIIPVFTRFLIPLAPGKTLNFGWSGSRTGTGAVALRPVNSDGTFGTVQFPTALSATASTRMNATVAGSSTVIGAEVYLTATSAAASTVSITSMQAQIWTTGASPTLTGNFQPGRGFSGFAFTGGVDETIGTDAGVTGNIEDFTIHTTIVEVGQWVRQ